MRLLMCTLLGVLFAISQLPAQAQPDTLMVAGRVYDAATGEPIRGVYISQKGSTHSSYSNFAGRFTQETNTLPITLYFWHDDYLADSLVIEKPRRDYTVKLTARTGPKPTMVYSTRRQPDTLQRTLGTAYVLTQAEAFQSASPSFYEALGELPGAYTLNNSLYYTTVNTRGFSDVGNSRMLQVVDGVETTAPLLGYSLGSQTAVAELDVLQAELLPGANGALHGANAFNGTLQFYTKDPFYYQGVDAVLKLGVAASDSAGVAPTTQFGVRMARKVAPNTAIKVNFNWQASNDWRAIDYGTDRFNSATTGPRYPTFDGVNTYGDETDIVIPASAIGDLGPLTIRRTGFTEEDLLDANEASSIKGNVALHHRFNQNMTGIAEYRLGSANGMAQDMYRTALRSFNQQFAKLELKNDHSYARVYLVTDHSSDSYDLEAVGTMLNEFVLPSEFWTQIYAQNYSLGMQGYLAGVPAGNELVAHDSARAITDTSEVSSFLPAVVRSIPLQRSFGGRIISNSVTYTGEGMYDLAPHLQNIMGGALEAQGGFRYRLSTFGSEGTQFNEAPIEGDTVFGRFNTNEFGAYLRAGLHLLNDRLYVEGAARMGKQSNLNATQALKAGLSFTPVANHTVRATMNTAYRYPTIREQYGFRGNAISGYQVGSVEDDAARYGLTGNGAYTASSWALYEISGDTSLLQAANLDYLNTPEQLTTYELGYRGQFHDHVTIDAHGYLSNYSNLLQRRTVHSSSEVAINDTLNVPAGTAFSTFVSAPETVTSFGAVLAIDARLPYGLLLSGHYAWADYVVTGDDDDNFVAGFNMPNHRYRVALSRAEIIPNLGARATWRWQSTYAWESAFATGTVPDFGVLDLQVNYKVPIWHVMLKMGATNMLGYDYYTHRGGPMNGTQVYASIYFKEFMN